ncbi:hypothetical protein F4804DRAFT_259852 [Jackrogersella minutella]|nr:hypothetical protein F4804DRAFT_259852 [Jackrogersella minutella]
MGCYSGFGRHDYAFITLTCQKLVCLVEEKSDDNESVNSHSSVKMHDHNFTHNSTNFSNTFNPQSLCTLQRFRASRNTPRTDYMGKNSTVAPRGFVLHNTPSYAYIQYCYYQSEHKCDTCHMSYRHIYAIDLHNWLLPSTLTKLSWR